MNIWDIYDNFINSHLSINYNRFNVQRLYNFVFAPSVYELILSYSVKN